MNGETKGTFVMRDLLLQELELAVRTTRELLKKIKVDEWSYRPADKMRTLQELAHHLVLVPASDLAILQEHSEEQVHKLDEEIAGITDAAVLGEAMDRGLQQLRTYMNGLTENELLTLKTKPFYLDHASTQAKWLVEITTHAFHHRAQLFNYLKQLGHPVTMFELY